MYQYYSTWPRLTPNTFGTGVACLDVKLDSTFPSRSSPSVDAVSIEVCLQFTTRRATTAERKRLQSTGMSLPQKSRGEKLSVSHHHLADPRRLLSTELSPAYQPHLDSTLPYLSLPFKGPNRPSDKEKDPAYAGSLELAC